MRKRLCILAAIAVLSVFGTAAWREGGFWRPGPLIESRIFGDYEVRIYCRHKQNIFERIAEKLPTTLFAFYYRIPGVREWDGVEVFRKGARVYAEYGCNLQIAEFGTNEVAGLDITGDGTPKLALSDSLGRQGGGVLVLFECGEKFRKIAAVESLGVFPKLRDLDGDGIPELIVSDNAFYHWPVCRDGEPMPEVILRWGQGKYVAAKDLMRTPAPAPAELEAEAARLRSSPEWEIGPTPEGIWTNAVALIYGGHEALAWQFVAAAWKPEFRDQMPLREDDLRARLEESIYWPDLKKVAPTNQAALKRPSFSPSLGALKNSPAVALPLRLRVSAPSR